MLPMSYAHAETGVRHTAVWSISLYCVGMVVSATNLEFYPSYMLYSC